LRLTHHEQEMLEGRHGEAKKFAMTVLAELGTIYGADGFVEVVSAHIMAHYGSLHDAGLELAERFVAMGGKFCIPTTEDPASVSFRLWRKLGIDEAYYRKQKQLEDAVMALGAQPVWTCTPYLVGNLPRLGQNVSWAESSAVSFANSVIGARTNRTPAGLNYCAAITGRMPNMGLYKTENRYGEVLVKVRAGELSKLDYNALGYLIGKTVGNKIPVLDGLGQSATVDHLKYLGAAAASSGAVAMYHAMDVTPEATGRDPFGGTGLQKVITIDRNKLQKAKQEMTTAQGGPDAMVVGCPHYSLQEIQTLADLLDGRRIEKNKALWVYTSGSVYDLARKMGYVETIEASGGTLMEGNCLVISPMGKANFKTLITDSAKFAYYLPSEHDLKVIFASTEECVQAILAD
jgi:predicted aconitase